MSKYSLDQLKQNLTKPGWRSVIGHASTPTEGRLAEMVEEAHARHTGGLTIGHLKEIETEIEVDMIQLEQLWLHMGLPRI